MPNSIIETLEKLIKESQIVNDIAKKIHVKEVMEALEQNAKDLVKLRDDVSRCVNNQDWKMLPNIINDAVKVGEGMKKTIDEVRIACEKTGKFIEDLDVLKKDLENTLKDFYKLQLDLSVDIQNLRNNLGDLSKLASNLEKICSDFTANIDKIKQDIEKAQKDYEKIIKDDKDKEVHVITKEEKEKENKSQEEKVQNDKIQGEYKLQQKEEIQINKEKKEEKKEKNDLELSIKEKVDAKVATRLSSIGKTPNVLEQPNVQQTIGGKGHNSSGFTR